jgi:hypothetical protein
MNVSAGRECVIHPHECLGHKINVCHEPAATVAAIEKRGCRMIPMSEKRLVFLAMKSSQDVEALAGTHISAHAHLPSVSERCHLGSASPSFH